MDDKTLIKRVNDGDLSAIRFLVEQYKNLIWHIIISLAGHNSDSEDLFQDVFLGVFKGCKRFRGDARLSTWIGSIAHHVCVDYIRKKKNNTYIHNLETDQQLMVNFTTDVSWKQIENEDLNSIVLATIAELPPDYRTVITLFHIDECSYRDIAEITGMPDGTVKSYISRGRNLLREKLLTIIPDLAEVLDDL
jgi:RNA polymerase sigma factor (sigma-70 family)